MSALAEAPWRLITGPNLPPADREKLPVTQGVTVETLRADYRELLSRAALSGILGTVHEFKVPSTAKRFKKYTVLRIPLMAPV